MDSASSLEAAIKTLFLGTDAEGLLPDELTVRLVAGAVQTGIPTFQRAVIY